jgi:hypothetical protein
VKGLAVIFQESVSDYSAEPATGTIIAMLDPAAMDTLRMPWQKKAAPPRSDTDRTPLCSSTPI